MAREERPRRLAIYPGSFDPIHNGHLDIVRRCLPLFEEVRVAVLRNEEKRPLFTVEERLEMISELTRDLSGCRVEAFSGLLVHYMRSVGATTIVRGLRALSDFEYEFQMALMNRRLSPEIETVFLMPQEEYTFVSSRLVKEVQLLGGDVSSLVPPVVLERLNAKRPASRE